jgi:arylsulfatase
MRAAEERPTIAPARTSYTYYPNTQKIPAFAVANILNRPHSITADVEIPEKGVEGVLLCSGGMEGGWTFYVKEDRLHYVHNLVARTFYHVQSREKVPKGRHKLRYDFEVTGKPDIQKGKGASGRGQLYFDGKLVGQVEMPVTTPLAFGLGANGVTCGTNRDSPVTPEYKPPFTFTGTIYSVTVDVSGELIRDSELEMRRIMRRQ